VSFHRSHVTSALASGNQWSQRARIGGHDFPSTTATAQQDQIAALEAAVLALNDAVARLAAEIERIDRTLAAQT